ncbi:MAG: IPTL-CTERM sorting domain-containing protein, partial [Acidobacteriota bacterium]
AATLTIDAARPGFSKSFDPAMVQLGGDSTLTFTIDNTLNGSAVSSLEFSDTLPPGLEIASPSNATTDCPLGEALAFFTAPAGGTTIAYDSGVNVAPPPPELAAGVSCTLTVDVTTTAVGSFDNRTSDLVSANGTSGKASDTLDVVVDELALQKSFVDDPAFPGGSATLEFSITNLNRNQTATGVAFTDDLDATLSGLVATDTPLTDPCGAGSSLTGTDLLTLSGGTLAPGETCTFRVTVQVPAGAGPGSYPNTTSSVTGTVNGGMVTGSAASDALVVDVFPVLTKTFQTSPVAAGGTVDLEFSITNTSSSSGATDISFYDVLSEFLAGATAQGLPMAACNGTLIQVTGFPFTGDVTLILNGASLAPGASCTFTVTLDVPAGATTNTYTNTTTEITATVGGSTRTGPPATDDLEVTGPPTLAKEFTDDPVQSGELVTLQFTLSHDELAPGDATSIAFTDDLNVALSGLAAVGLPQNDVCGVGSQISGTTSLSFTGGTLAPGESCTFPVTLQVPVAAAAGFHQNTTSAVTATVDGLATTGLAATDNLLITGLELTKEFVGDPALPGGTVILRFTITNAASAPDASGILVQDDLGDVLPGLAATGLPLVDPCGTGSVLQGLSGNTFLSLSGGSVPAGSPCTVDVTLQVPLGAASGEYPNVTTTFQAVIDDTPVVLPNASDSLLLDADLLSLSKEFVGDPVPPGGSVTLRFTLTNLSATETVDDIAFTDDLDAALTGLASSSGTLTDVCGTGSQIAGAGTLAFTGGTLGPGESCTVDVTVDVPMGTSATAAANTTSTVSGNAGGLPVQGPAASDTLQISQLTFVKAFDGPTGATGTAVLELTITNDGGFVAEDLAFQDDLDAVLPGLTAVDLPKSDVCGTGSALTGGSLVSFSGGSLDAGGSCTFGLTVEVPAGAAPGSYLNTTTDLRSAGLPVAVPATATLQIEPPPGFTKVFSPAAIPVNGVSTLTFTVDNGASVLDATGLSFTDDLPAGLEVAATPAAITTCGGTVTAPAGAGIVSFSGGGVTAGASCTVQVDVTGTAEGTFVNTSGDLISSLGSSPPASDTLDVVVGDFVALKSFRTGPVLPGGLVEMELSIVNGSTFPLTGVALTDDLGAVLPGLAAEGLPLMDVCGAGSQVSGTSVVSLTGGNLAAGTSCTVVVPVRVPADAAAGSLVNTTSAVTGLREGVPVDAEPASAELVVTLARFTKSFGMAQVPAGFTTVLTFEITNPDPANGLTGLTFTDDLDAVLPGLVAIGTPLADVCGAGSQLAGDSLLTLTGGSLGPGGSCLFAVTVRVPSVSSGGTFENVTSPLDGAVDGAAISGGAAAAARANLVVQGPFDIPTLSEWMLLLLGAMLAVFGLWRLRP